MKRSFLEELGLEKDAIDKIMAVNGSDIERAKGDLDQLRTQLQGLQDDVAKRDGDLKDLQEKLTAAQADAGKLSDAQGQLASIQAEYQAKQQEWTDKQKEWEAETARRNYRAAAKAEMGKLKFSSAAASREFERDIEKAALKVDGEKLIGFSDFVDKWKAENADAFTEDKPADNPGSSGGDKPFPPKGGGGQNTQSKFGFHFTPIHPMPENG